MSAAIEIIGTFADEHACVHAVETLKREGIGNHRFRVFAPIPSEHLALAIGRGLSPVRVLVLIGGITGVLTGLAVTIGTAMEWNLVSGGRPIISMPPYIIIMFELMILFGGVLALLGFLFFAGLPQLDPVGGYSERFGADRFGIAVGCGEDESARIEALLRGAGAEDVVHEASPGQILAVPERPHS
jgi:ActD protein